MLISFNLNQNNYDDPVNQWPASLQFDSSRLWDTGVTWRDIETSAGVYNFARLDAQINLNISRGITDILYTAGKTPAFYGGGSAGAAPPSDIDAGNVFYSNFVTALSQHILATFPQITLSFEPWNEPNLQQFWTGTAQQLLVIARSAYGILHPKGIKVLCPPGSGGTAIGNFILTFLTACAGNFPFDVFAYHAYLQNHQTDPSAGMDLILNDIKVKKNSFGISAMETWFTEGSWSQTTDYTPALTDQQQANYLNIQYAKMSGAGGLAAKVTRYYWYALNNSHGFGVIATGSPLQYNAAGQAYQALFAAEQPAKVTQINMLTPASVVKSNPIPASTMEVHIPGFDPQLVPVPPAVFPITLVDSTKDRANHVVTVTGSTIKLSDKTS
jgi:polysaccharide biosynthesis protein PslG